MMKSYSEYLIEAKTHLEHAEEFILNSGKAGLALAVKQMRGTIKQLSGHSKSAVNITVKYDGAPAIFFGIDPADGKYFVGTKTIFNKEPVLIKSPSDAPAGELGEKLSAAIEHFPKLGLKRGMILGDLMFTASSLKTATIESKAYLTFKPNTILYAVPAETPLAATMKAAKIGIVWHTQFAGDSIASMKPLAGKPISQGLRQHKDVWHDDVKIKDLSGTATMTTELTAELLAELNAIEKNAAQISDDLITRVATNNSTVALIKKFINQNVRAAKPIEADEKFVADLRTFLASQFPSDGKSIETRAPAKVLFDHSNAEIKKLFHVIALIVDVKLKIIKHLDRLTSLGTFVETKNGLEVVGHEGFVISDRLGKNMMKLVDRMEFSRYNFSPDTIKGFSK
ncbi:MAG: hypothetical protein DDT26_00300 [Dehalococcoidia bacterium]|nr:hypothetical protein [Chloroflexota bacterium]